MKVIYEREIDARRIFVSPRPVWKCRTCPMYGKSPSCPPHAPSWEEAKKWVSHFTRALLIKFEVSYENFEREKREVLEYLLKREGESPYAFALFPGNCNLCDECEFMRSGECAMPTKVRPSINAIGIEISNFVEIDFRESVLYGLILIE